jgi:hypothetical protein
MNEGIPVIRVSATRRTRRQHSQHPFYRTLRNVVPAAGNEAICLYRRYRKSRVERVNTFLFVSQNNNFCASFFPDRNFGFRGVENAFDAMSANWFDWSNHTNSQ